jgi:hypothetical protein
MNGFQIGFHGFEWFFTQEIGDELVVAFVRFGFSGFPGLLVISQRIGQEHLCWHSKDKSDQQYKDCLFGRLLINFSISRPIRSIFGRFRSISRADGEWPTMLVNPYN